MNSRFHILLTWLVALAILFTGMTCLCTASDIHHDSADAALPPCHHHSQQDHQSPTHGHDCCFCQSTLVAAPDTAKSPDLSPDLHTTIALLAPNTFNFLAIQPTPASSIDRHTAAAPSPPTSLLRLHCALIV